MRGEFGHNAVGQRPDGVIVVLPQPFTGQVDFAFD
jgi:hypothetical protein